MALYISMFDANKQLFGLIQLYFLAHWCDTCVIGFPSYFNPENKLSKSLRERKTWGPCLGGCVCKGHCVHCYPGWLRVGTFSLDGGAKLGVNEMRVRGIVSKPGTKCKAYMIKKKKMMMTTFQQVGTNCLLEMLVNHSRSWNVLDDCGSDILLKDLRERVWKTYIITPRGVNFTMLKPP